MLLLFALNCTMFCLWPAWALLLCCVLLGRCSARAGDCAPSPAGVTVTSCEPDRHHTKIEDTDDPEVTGYVTMLPDKDPRSHHPCVGAAAGWGCCCCSTAELTSSSATSLLPCSSCSNWSAEGYQL
ncbi:uncharacterized protein LOC134535312 isoform X2 [Bacillus rossius redtenbacheri]|uniref:uncharacterized protein LOC134535312 isoform X2 n=1 Tax=Bacillus rossius redtenbacheri TaxID=93214 RepID=UPI002FDC87E5